MNRIINADRIYSSRRPRFFWIFTPKNEVGFDGQRSLLHLASKLTSFGIEAYFIFFCAKNRVCGLTICGLTILVDHFKLYL